jgi:hypothetical protein
VLALLQLRFNGTSASSDEQIPTAKQLKQFLQDSAAQGMAAELILDRDMLEVQEDRSEADQEEEDKWGPLRELQTWLLAGLGLLLLLCIVAALLFCTFRGRRRRSQHRTFVSKTISNERGRSIRTFSADPASANAEWPRRRPRRDVQRGRHRRLPPEPICAFPLREGPRE